MCIQINKYVRDSRLMDKKSNNFCSKAWTDIGLVGHWLLFCILLQILEGV